MLKIKIKKEKHFRNDNGIIANGYILSFRTSNHYMDFTIRTFKDKLKNNLEHL